jgi:hypothetical protein
MTAVGGIGGGIALLALAGFHWFGIIAGALLVIGGLALSGSKSDRKVGIVTTIVGAASLATGILGRWLPGIPWLMRAAGILLIGVGIYSVVKFLRGVKSRS